jgi:diguanylate cyclase (GGDEF)-like protein
LARQQSKPASAIFLQECKPAQAARGTKRHRPRLLNPRTREKPEHMPFNQYVNPGKKSLFLRMARFVAEHWKAILFAYSALIILIFIRRGDLNFLIAAWSTFVAVLLYAQNIDLFIKANRDKLTGLGNKNYLKLQLEKEIARVNRQGGCFAFLFFDLDNFKEVNDTLGHKVGDCVLIEVADRLRARMRKYDESIRYGGDEFCVICPQVKNEDVSRKIGEKLQEFLNFYFRSEKHAIFVGASVGVATYPTDSDNLQELISIADQRMYEQKRQRKMAKTLKMACDPNG